MTCALRNLVGLDRVLCSTPSPRGRKPTKKKPFVGGFRTKRTTQRSPQDQVLFLVKLEACHRFPVSASIWLTWTNLHPSDTYYRPRCLFHCGCLPLSSSECLDLATCLIDSMTYTAVKCSLSAPDVKRMNVIKDSNSPEEYIIFCILYHMR